MNSKDRKEIKEWGLLEKSATLKAEHGHYQIALMLEKWATRKHNNYMKGAIA